RPGDPPDLRGADGRRARRGGAERGGRDRGCRNGEDVARGTLPCARGDRLGGRRRAARAADRVHPGGGSGLMGRFRNALAGPGLAAIAEFKRRSPSAGDIRPGADPAELARAYAAAGAAAISVLVDERFAGSFADLRATRAATHVPLLAKGFFTEELHLLDAKTAGADAALLLLRDLDDERAAALMRYAGELELDTLVEAHDADEPE